MEAPPFHHDQPLIPGKASCGKNIIDGYQNSRILLNWQLFDWKSYLWLGKKMGILVLFAAHTDQPSGAEHVEVSGRVLG